MKTVAALLLLSASLCLGDKPAVAPAYYDEPAVAPAYEAPAQETYGAPVAQPARQQQDVYGSPSAPPVQVAEADSYGSPQAAPIATDSYGSPAAPPKTQYQAQAQPQQTAAAPGNQGYYYYYYPVRQSAPAPAEAEDDDSIIGLVTALLTKKIVLIALGLGAFLVVTALGINISFGRRSFARSMESGWEMVSPYMTEGNLITLADFVNNSIRKFQ